MRTDIYTQLIYDINIILFCYCYMVVNKKVYSYSIFKYPYRVEESNCFVYKSGSHALKSKTAFM